MGGDLNAWTSFEQTVLHATVPAAHVETALEVICAMGTSPHLDPDELERERGVVIEEIRGSRDDPGSVLADATRARAFGAHPYGRPILGTVESVGAIDQAALRRFHDQHYVADNAILAVAGPVDPDVLSAAAGLRLPIGGPRRPPRRVAELPTEFARPGCFVLDPGFEERLIEVSFPVPGHAHPDTAAMDLLAVGIGEGTGSLLSQALRHEQDLAISTWSALEADAAGGMLVLGCAPRDGRAESATRAIWDVIERVAREGLPADVLRRARASARADRLRERETVDGRANRLGWYVAAFGDPQAEAWYEAALAGVSVGDIRRVAARVLKRERALVGAVAPAAELDATRLTRASSASRVAHRPVQSPHAGIRRATLQSGIEVVMLPDPEAELLGMSVMGIGGAIAEGPTIGLATAGRPLSDGGWAVRCVELSAVAEAGGWTPGVDRPQHLLGAGGIPVGGRTNRDRVMGHMLVAPRFSDKEVARTRADLLELQRSVGTAPASWPGTRRGRRCTPATWGRPSGGTPQCRPGDAGPSAGNASTHGPGRNLVVGVAGGFEPDEIVPLLERTLGTVRPGDALPASPPGSAVSLPGSTVAWSHEVTAWPRSSSLSHRSVMAIRMTPQCRSWQPFSGVSPAAPGGCSMRCVSGSGSPTASGAHSSGGSAEGPCCVPWKPIPSARRRPVRHSGRNWTGSLLAT